jgi:hypothetical protein
MTVGVMENALYSSYTLAVFATHRHHSVAAVTSAGNRCPASSVLDVSIEGATTTIATPDWQLWSVLAKFWSQWRQALIFGQSRNFTGLRLKSRN